MASMSWGEFWEMFPEIYLEPIVTAVAAGAVLAFLGVYVVTRRMVFISAALSQVSGLGVAFAFFLGVHVGDLGPLSEPVVMALGLSLAATLFFRMDPARLGLTRNALLGLSYALAGALTLVLGEKIVGTEELHEAGGIDAILFGSAVAVRSLDLWLTVAVGGVILALHVLLIRGLAFISFDPVAARVQGLPVRALDAFLFVTIAVAVAITTRALGALPVFAFTVLPAMAALAVSRRLGKALWLATVFGALSGFLGYLYATFLDLPVGASQATVAGVICVLAMGARLARDRTAHAPRRVAAGAGAGLALLLALLPLASLGEEASAPPHTHTELPGLEHEPSKALPPTGGGDAPGELPLKKLIATLRTDPNPDHRAKAAHRLGRLHASEAREALVAAMADEDWNVRAEAAEALGHLGGPLPKVLLRAIAQDDSNWVREAAAGALCHYATDSAAQTALEQAAANDPDADVRAVASRHIGTQCKADEPH